jgi:hypothetical protein
MHDYLPYRERSHNHALKDRDGITRTKALLQYSCTVDLTLCLPLLSFHQSSSTQFLVFNIQIFGRTEDYSLDTSGHVYLNSQVTRPM